MSVNKNNKGEATPLLLPTKASDAVPAFRINDSSDSIRSIHLLPGMKLRAHEIQKDGRLSPLVSAKEALASVRMSSSSSSARSSNKKSKSYWIDIDADERDRQELEQWLQQLKISPFLQTRLAEPADTWSTQVVTLDDCILAVFQILPVQENSDDLAHMAVLLLGPNLLLTFTSCPRSDTGGLYAQALASMHARGGLPEPSSCGALCAWLQYHVERTSASVRQLRSCHAPNGCPHGSGCTFGIEIRSD